MTEPGSTSEFQELGLPSVPTLEGSNSAQALPHQTKQSSLQQSSAGQATGAHHISGITEPTTGQAKNSRSRRRAPPGSDHVKHRRTRSGCYTCRSRRVKCDENHPICERCRKGGRDCVYPESSVLPKSSSSSSKRAGLPPPHESPSSSTDEYEDDDDIRELQPIANGEEDATDLSKQSSQYHVTIPQSSIPCQESNQHKSSTRNSSEAPSLMQDKGPSPSPSTEGSIGYINYNSTPGLRANASSGHHQSSSGYLRGDWSHLPQDMQFYLDYFCRNVTNHHYSLKQDTCNFLHTAFLDITLRNDALLYAVVGFSAFQRTLHISGGKIQDFLQYYNKAVSILLQSLKKGARRNIGTLLAILQLATIEEHLGDWVNLLGHQKAAHEILTEIYTPQTIMGSDLTRTILSWYARFDVFAGLMGGFETVLSRGWFSNAQEFFQCRIDEEPDNIHWKIEQAVASHRLIAMDMSILFAKRGKGGINHEQFIAENEIISQRVADWRYKLDPALQDPQWRVTEFPGAQVDPDDIVNPYQPGILYHGPLWPMNLCMIDWYSVDLMHKYQTALALGTEPSKELGITAYASCQLFEAIEYWPHAPKGSILACQASLPIATLFLPRDKPHHMWCRRKLAVIESNGYIYSTQLREKMSALFQDLSCLHWWLPNDEKYPIIIRQMRKFVDERTAPARSVPAEDLRDMKAVFASMNLDDGKKIRAPEIRTTDFEDPMSVPKEPQWSSLGVSNETEPLPRETGADIGGSYGLTYEPGQGHWSGGQGGRAYGIPDLEDYS